MANTIPDTTTKSFIFHGAEVLWHFKAVPSSWALRNKRFARTGKEEKEEPKKPSLQGLVLGK
jgi:hypothetical protein